MYKYFFLFYVNPFFHIQFVYRTAHSGMLGD